MKKVLSILVSVALVLSCCIVAFASDTTCTAGELAEYIGWQVTDEEVARVITENNVSIDPSAVLTTEQIAQVLEVFLNDGCMTESNARGVIDSIKNMGKIDDSQVTELNAAVDAWVAAHPAEDPSTGGEGGEGGESGGSGDSGSGSGLPFDIGDITNIFSNLGGNIDLSQFLEGAKSGIGQLLDGIKGAGLPDLSSITGLLGGLGGGGDILGTIMGLLGMGGDDNGGGNGGSTTPGTNPYTPSTNPSGGNSNSQVIPKTADTAPIAAVAALAAVAGVAFVLTRKKNED